MCDLAKGNRNRHTHEEKAFSEVSTGMLTILLNLLLNMPVDGLVVTVSTVGRAIPNMEMMELKQVARRYAPFSMGSQSISTASCPLPDTPPIPFRGRTLSHTHWRPPVDSHSHTDTTMCLSRGLVEVVWWVLSGRVSP